jgi:hypothetical protein
MKDERYTLDNRQDVKGQQGTPQKAGTGRGEISP